MLPQHHLRFVSLPLTMLLFVTSLTGDEIDFNRDIRPILSDKCFQCHGPDVQTREADLRLDTKTGAMEDRGGYAAFVPGEPDQSDALRRIFTADEDERMPPRDSNLELTDAEGNLLRRRVKQGATWTDHWAFLAPLKPSLPLVKDVDWPRNEIDHFVLARIESARMQPAPEADKRTLIRRVTLDLTGLPPTVAEVNRFLADDSPLAYERVVDRLLQSPRYGERMAWDWLDAARYADTDGFQGDPARTMWPWRDWLIKALNSNMPFDQFTIEMIAGDLLTDATSEQIIATGFNRNHMHNGEGGRIAEETRVENVFDRTETTSTVWLGLTMTCARCHDHKFDPVTQREYYQLYAFFNNTSENGRGRSGKTPPVIDYRTPRQTQQAESLSAQIAELARKMGSPHAELDPAQAAWEAKTKTALEQLAQESPSPVTLIPWWVLGPIPVPDGDASFARDLGPEAGVDLDRRYADDKFVWRQETGFVDGQVHELPTTVGVTYLFRRIETATQRTLDLSLGSDDGIKVWLNNRELLANNATRGAAPDQEKLRLDLQSGTNDLLIKIVNTGGIAGFYFQRVSDSRLGLPNEVAGALDREPDDRSDQQQAQIRNFFRREHSERWKAWAAEKSQLEQTREQIQQAAASVMVMDRLPDDKRRTTSILGRGTYNKPLEKVSAGTPSFLPPLPAETRMDRLILARWLVSNENPLTARVTTNRYWQIFFRRGLVETSEDFGRQGALPTHPALLDWLATTFMESGWDVKALHRRIVMSATYRQSSQVVSVARDTTLATSESSPYNRDPDNRLLARGPRFRMPSWMLRDQALFLSGQLAGRIGGPAVRPYQPPGIWAEATFGKIRYQQDSGASLYRRSIYTFWRRIVGPTMFFDGSKRQTCEVKQTLTNTPLHALTTLNETTFVEAARNMAERAIKRGGQTPAERIEYAFQMVTARMPTSSERQQLIDHWRGWNETYRANPEEAAKLLDVGKSSRDQKIDASEHAAFTLVCSLLLNLDEVLTKE